VGKDFAEVCTRFGHRFGTGLAESNPVSLADSPQYYLLAFFSRHEGVARDGAPS
jgi:hypothetical protein